MGECAREGRVFKKVFSDDGKMLLSFLLTYQHDTRQHTTEDQQQFGQTTPQLEDFLKDLPSSSSFMTTATALARTAAASDSRYCFYNGDST